MTRSDVGPLLPAARAGCKASLGRVLQACHSYLHWVAMREIDPEFGSKAGASDLVQETFLDASRSFDRFQGETEAELLAWLRRMLRDNISNLARRYRDTAKRRAVEVPIGDPDVGGPEPAAAGAPPEDVVSERERDELLREALGRLPDDYRRIMHLWQVEGLSFEEIARTLGCSPSNVRAKWGRAVARLQQQLEFAGE